MRRFIGALVAVVALALTAVGVASADTVTVTGPLGHYTCTITYTDNDGSGTLTWGDTITAIDCVRNF
jgi:hypothetical protein